MLTSLKYTLIGFILGFSSFANGQEIKAPVFKDPNYFGSCDPEIIYNPLNETWYIYYTSRRSLLQNNFLKTPIGVATSTDFKNWSFAGYCKFDGVGGEKDSPTTFWAPAIIRDGDELHMFVTWKPDTDPTKEGAWGGPAKIVHYKTSLKNPINGWVKVADMHSEDLNSLDATVYKMDGVYHVWFKGKKDGEKKNELFHLTSTDLVNWNNKGFSKSDVFNPAVTGQKFEEAPYVFFWENKSWLITDTHQGLLVYESADGENWHYQTTILKEGSDRSMDNNAGRHCSVALRNGKAYIIYHVEPWRDYEGEAIYKQPTSNRRSVLQMAELKLVNGIMVCKRD